LVNCTTNQKRLGQLLQLELIWIREGNLLYYSKLLMTFSIVS